VKPAELGEEIALELEALEATVKELLALQRDVARREPTVRERTAAAAFLAQFYNGTENILKRISHYHDVPLPTGEAWHVSCSNASVHLPIQVSPCCSTKPWRPRWPHIAASGTWSSTATDFS
jgi:hypothetical protein